VITFISFLSAKISLPVNLLDRDIPVHKYTGIDLSADNADLGTCDISDPDACQEYINSVLARTGAVIAYGGYLEKRNLYRKYAEFSQGDAPDRDIHLGLDLWCPADTRVCVPMDGKIHSFRNNDKTGDYGPTIILEHHIHGITFYTLYGHLSVESLAGIQVGDRLSEGLYFAAIGTPDINVNYAPHLHFQIILDIGDYRGDYPGVCREADLPFYRNNCPDPGLLLKF
jgi:murein DD-endopeptidase MepM/ murein hydrolase activator NlpD